MAVCCVFVHFFPVSRARVMISHMCFICRSVYARLIHLADLLAAQAPTTGGRAANKADARPFATPLFEPMSPRVNQRKLGIAPFASPSLRARIALTEVGQNVCVCSLVRFCFVVVVLFVSFLPILTYCLHFSHRIAFVAFRLPFSTHALQLSFVCFVVCVFLCLFSFRPLMNVSLFV